MSELAIGEIVAREVLNGIGDPTVEVDVVTEGGVRGRASVPSGASTGRYEALQIRDGGNRFGGRGVLGAVANANREIAPLLRGMDVTCQREIDEVMKELDGSENKSRLGANALLAVSLAVADAASKASGEPLYRYLGGSRPVSVPRPMANVMAGGKHAGNALDIEDHLIFPVEGISFREATQGCVEIYRQVGRILERRYGPVRTTGGAWSPPVVKEGDALDLIVQAIRDAGYEDRFVMGLDVAASQLYSPSGRYRLASGELSREELVRYYQWLVDRYPIKLIEDPFEEDDFASFQEITTLMKGTQIVGDDLFVTNRERVEKGVALGAANAVLFKINQAGTLTDALDTAAAAQRAGYDLISSVRAGESEDTFVADIAVAIGASLIKLGAPARGERNSKYNRLMRIEEELLTGR